MGMVSFRTPRADKNPQQVLHLLELVIAPHCSVLLLLLCPPMSGAGTVGNAPRTIEPSPQLECVAEPHRPHIPPTHFLAAGG